MSSHRDTAIASANVTVLTAASTPVVTANINREELTICNDGVNVVYLMLQTTGAAPVAVASNGIRLAAGGTYTTHTYRGAVAGIAAIADTVVTVATI